MLNKNLDGCRDFTNCTVLKESRHKKLLRGPIDPAAPHELYLIKIYFYPGLWQRVKYAFRQGRARQEMSLAGRISAKGIPTIVPRQARDLKKRGFLHKSIVVTEYLSGCMNLEELLIKQPLSDRHLKRKVLYEYGRLARLIHDQGVFQEDFDPNNILYQPKPDGTFQLYFIDFEKTRLVETINEKQRIHILAKLNRMGQRLGGTDQMRFLTAYLGPQSDRRERKQWARRIRREEKSVLITDRRRAWRKSASVGKKIGFIQYDGYQGYYRKRHHSRECFTRADIAGIIQAIENDFSGRENQTSPTDRIITVTAQLHDREASFQVQAFAYGGFFYCLPGTRKKTPLINAWREDNGCLKNRSADFMPVAAVEKRVAPNRFQGFLIRQI